MSNELQPVSQRTLPAIPAETIGVLKKTICVDHTDDQVKLFMMYCQAKGLDPFAREVFSIIRKGKQTFQTGIDGLRSMAEETGQYDGCELFWCAKDGKWFDAWLLDEAPYAAKAVVSKIGCAKPFIAVAKWSEYKPEEDWMWKKMPSNQLAKCAEALALRKAFPRKLGGLYASEEMQQADKKGAFASAPAETSVPMPQEKAPQVQDAQISEKKPEREKIRALLFKLAKFSWGKDYETNFRKYLSAKFNTEHTSSLTDVQLDEALRDLKETADAAQANAPIS